MRLDRKLIKEQAKQLIKNNIWKLLLISLVVAFLSGASGIGTVFDYNEIKDTISSFGDKDDAYDDFNPFGGLEDFDNSQEVPDDENEFDPGYFNDFEFEGEGKFNLIPSAKLNALSLKLRDFSGSFSLLSFIMLPLTVTLWGVYISLVRGKCFEIDESFSYVFGKSFDKNYFKKLALCLLSGLFTALWSLLFIIPGIVYLYKIRFAYAIMAEHPELSPMEAINLSKRMTDGHKGELFVLDLSFIPWILLEIVTLGIVSIYFLPYKNTVDALYYVNFKVRCEQEGRIMPQDYISQRERMQQVAQQQNNTDYYQPQQNGAEYYNPQQRSAEYYAPRQNSSDYYNAQQSGNYNSTPQNGSEYYSSKQNSTDYYNAQHSSGQYYQPSQQNAPYCPPQEVPYAPACDNDNSNDEDSFGSSMNSDYWNGGNF